MKEFLKKELYSFRAVAAILARWLLLAVPTGLVCGAVGTAFHLAVEQVTEWRAEHIWLLWLLPDNDPRDFLFLLGPLSILVGINYELAMRRYGHTFRKWLILCEYFAVGAAVAIAVGCFAPEEFLSSFMSLTHTSDFSDSFHYRVIAVGASALLLLLAWAPCCAAWALPLGCCWPPICTGGAGPARSGSCCFARRSRWESSSGLFCSRTGRRTAKSGSSAEPSRKR